MKKKNPIRKNEEREVGSGMTAPRRRHHRLGDGCERAAQMNSSASCLLRQIWSETFKAGAGRGKTWDETRAGC